MGAMSVRSFDYAGIKTVVVDNLGDGSIMVEGGADADVVEGSIEAEDSLLADVQIRQAHDSLRISLPQRSWRRTSSTRANTTGHTTSRPVQLTRSLSSRPVRKAGPSSPH